MWWLAFLVLLIVCDFLANVSELDAPSSMVVSAISYAVCKPIYFFPNLLSHLFSLKMLVYEHIP